MKKKQHTQTELKWGKQAGAEAEADFVGQTTWLTGPGGY